MQEEQQHLRLVTKKVYSIFQKIFCCLCFDCLKADDESLLTSQIRKKTFQRMIENYVIKNEEGHSTQALDSFTLMIIMYLSKQKTISHKLIQNCRINPDIKSIQKYRMDLQFYIPQICNFLVFHQDLKNQLLVQDLLALCKTNYYFAHLYYFYILSLQKVINKTQTKVWTPVTEYKIILLQQLIKQFHRNPENKRISRISTIKKSHHQLAINETIFKYGTIQQDECNPHLQIHASDIALPNYFSIYSQQMQQKNAFKSTINFFEDLFLISADIKIANPKSKALKYLLKKVNQRLPAQVYVPFSKNGYRFYNVLNIVTFQSKVFSTKERAPFYICLQVFDKIQTIEDNDYKLTEIARNKAIILKNKNSIAEQYDTLEEPILFANKSSKEGKRNSDLRSVLLEQFKQSDRVIQTSEKVFSNKLIQFTNTMEMVNRRDLKNQKKSKQQEQIIKLQSIFGENQHEISFRIKAKSIFSHLKTWRLLHLMVKTGDNLKQQQFALQLIYQFDHIFQSQLLDLKLTPYEVISMGPDCGVMEMIKQSITIDGLLKKLNTQFSNITNLKEFFEVFYKSELKKARLNFIKSLAGYSLVQYFLQIKDRHNGNILLHRNGKIIHIDFGFFLSNAPGKGLELEKKSPFKLNMHYIEVLNGIDSQYFQLFRKYFFQGFQAARKHQDRILILVKMMYSSSGATMPCFQKGLNTIKELEQRFNPPSVTNDFQLSEFCQKLINESLDNWATRWYDKWQYWMQGIYY